MDNRTSNRELLCELGLEEAIIFSSPEFDSAIIGYTEDNRIVYDYDLMVKSLILQDGCAWDEAAEFIDYNTLKSYIFNGPIVIHTLIESE